MTEPNAGGPATTDEPIRFGHYLIHEILGVGGMAEIYRGSVEGPEAFRKAVVIKRVKPEYAANQHHVEMFIDEARINARLDHAHIVSVFDFGETEGHYFLAMEYIDGLNLQVLHVRHKRITGQNVPWQASLIMVRDVLRALDYAHHMTDEQGAPLGIVHRDVNLVNVMVRRDGTVKLLDFGCAKASQSIRTSQTVAGIIKGKVAYMSPEQTRDKPLDGRTDVFASAIVLHELLTGRRLFHGTDELKMLHAVRDKEIPDPRIYSPEIPEALALVTMKGLERDLDRRYSSAQEMADALHEIAHEHRISGTLLRDLMVRMMTEDQPPEQRAVSAKHKKLTNHTWKHEAIDDAPKTPWSIAGVIEPAPPSGPTDDEVPTLERAPVLASAPDWLVTTDARGADPQPYPLSEEANPWSAPADTEAPADAWMGAGDQAPTVERPRDRGVPTVVWFLIAAAVVAVAVFVLLKMI